MRPIIAAITLIGTVLTLGADVSAGPKDQRPDRITDHPAHYAEKSGGIGSNWKNWSEDFAGQEDMLSVLPAWLGHPIERVVGHLGFTETNYHDVGALKDRLKSELGGYGPNTLHIFMVSQKGLPSLIVDVMKELLEEPGTPVREHPYGSVLAIYDERGGDQRNRGELLMALHANKVL